MTRLKKIFSAAAGAFAAVCFSAALSVGAAAATAVDDGYKYSLNTKDSTAKVTGFNTNSEYYDATVVSIPATVDDKEGNTYTVVGIDSGAFSGRTAVTSVDIPDTVTEIGPNAFKGLTALESLRINAALDESGAPALTIGQNAFGGCTSLADVEIENVKTIDKNAFSGCKLLTDINLTGITGTVGKSAFPDVVTLSVNNIDELSAEMFGGADSLTYLTIGERVGTIPDSGFRKCTKLTEIIIPMFDSIGKSAFAGCSSATSAIIAGNETKASYIGDGAFSDCLLLETVAVMGTDTAKITIGDRAFSGCTVLNGVLFENVCAIGEEAFKDCISLYEFLLPENSFETLGEGLFKGCVKLESVQLNTSAAVTASMFENCTSLSELYIFNSEKIGSAAFKGSGSLTKLTLSNVAAVDASAFEGCTKLADVSFLSEANYIIVKSTVNSRVTYSIVRADTAGPLSYMSSPLLCGNETDETIIVPNASADGTATTAIGDSAFKDCPALYTLVLENVASIGDHAFENCTALEELGICADLTDIGEGAFSGCTALAGIRADDNDRFFVESSDRALYKVNDDKTYTLLLTTVTDDDETLDVLPKTKIVKTSNLNAKSIYFPESVEIIDGALSGFEHIDFDEGFGNSLIGGVTVSDYKAADGDVFTIPAALEGKIRLEGGVYKTIEIDRGTERVGSFIAYSNSDSKETYSAHADSLSPEYNALGAGVTLETITIPESVTSINDILFYNPVEPFATPTKFTIVAAPGSYAAQYASEHSSYITYEGEYDGTAHAVYEAEVPNDIAVLHDSAINGDNRIEFGKITDGSLVRPGDRLIIADADRTYRIHFDTPDDALVSHEFRRIYIGDKQISVFKIPKEEFLTPGTKFTIEKGDRRTGCDITLDAATEAGEKLTATDCVTIKANGQTLGADDLTGIAVNTEVSYEIKQTVNGLELKSAYLGTSDLIEKNALTDTITLKDDITITVRYGEPQKPEEYKLSLGLKYTAADGKQYDLTGTGFSAEDVIEVKYTDAAEGSAALKSGDILSTGGNVNYTIHTDKLPGDKYKFVSASAVMGDKALTGTSGTLEGINADISITAVYEVLTDEPEKKTYKLRITTSTDPAGSADTFISSVKVVKKGGSDALSDGTELTENDEITVSVPEEPSGYTLKRININGTDMGKGEISVTVSDSTATDGVLTVEAVFTKNEPEPTTYDVEYSVTPAPYNKASYINKFRKYISVNGSKTGVVSDKAKENEKITVTVDKKIPSSAIPDGYDLPQINIHIGSSTKFLTNKKNESTELLATGNIVIEFVLEEEEPPQEEKFTLSFDMTPYAIRSASLIALLASKLTVIDTTESRPVYSGSELSMGDILLISDANLREADAIVTGYEYAGYSITNGYTFASESETIAVAGNVTITFNFTELPVEKKYTLGTDYSFDGESTRLYYDPITVYSETNKTYLTDTVTIGEKLRIYVTPPDQHIVESVTVYNGGSVSDLTSRLDSSSSVTVTAAGNVDILVVFRVKSYNLYVSPTEPVNIVSKDRKVRFSGWDKFDADDTLYISYTKTDISDVNFIVTVNGNDNYYFVLNKGSYYNYDAEFTPSKYGKFSDGTTFTITAKSTASSTDTTKKSYYFINNVSSYVTVTKNGVTLRTGDTLSDGDLITLNHIYTPQGNTFSYMVVYQNGNVNYIRSDYSSWTVRGNIEIGIGLSPDTNHLINRYEDIEEEYDEDEEEPDIDDTPSRGGNTTGRVTVGDYYSGDWVMLDNRLDEFTAAKSEIITKSTFFDNPVVVTIMPSQSAQKAAQDAAALLTYNDPVICAFDISIFDTVTNKQLHSLSDGYITFRLVIPDSLAPADKNIRLYHLGTGKPELMATSVLTGSDGVKRIVFSASEFSPFMMIAENTFDAASGTKNNVPASDSTGNSPDGISGNSMDGNSGNINNINITNGTGGGDEPLKVVLDPDRPVTVIIKDENKAPGAPDPDLITEKGATITIDSGNANPHTGVAAAVLIPAAVVGCAFLAKKPKKTRKRAKRHVDDE